MIFAMQTRIPVVLSVASSYGVQVLDHVWDSSVRVGRANEEKIEHWLQSGAFSLVIDATHPYAKEVTANIKQACFRQGIRYLRLLRDLGDQSGALEFASAQKARHIWQIHRGISCSPLEAGRLMYLRR